MSLRRAHHSSRGVLPTVVHRWAYSRNLLNDEAPVQWGLLPKKQTKHLTWKSVLITSHNFWLWANKHISLWNTSYPDCWLNNTNNNNDDNNNNILFLFFIFIILLFLFIILFIMLTAPFMVVLFQVRRLNVCITFPPSILSTRPAHLILLYFVALILFCEEYKFTVRHPSSKEADTRPSFFPYRERPKFVPMKHHVFVRTHFQKHLHSL